MSDHILGRRDFLAASAWAAASVPMARLAALQVADDDQRVPVVRVVSDHVVRGHYIHPTVLAEMLELTLTRLTGRDSASDAWRSLLRRDDLIGLKFNGSGAEALATNEAVAEAVITSLLTAGFEERQIVAIEAPEATYRRHGVIRPTRGWQLKPTDFGSGADQFSAVLDQVTAIVNVPFLKTHNIAGMTCSLKNLSHALVKHPASYHGNHCSPYIGDIVGVPLIREKIRLNLVNALRIVFDKGPEPRSNYTWDAGMLLGGIDPVATDATGLGIVNAQRVLHGLRPIDPAVGAIYLPEAAKRKIGVSRPHEIERIKLRI